MDAWHVFKWVWVAVCFVWLAMQALALRRLKGDLKRRSMNVFWVVLVLMMVSDWVREVFENLEATRVGMLFVGVAALVAAVLLARMLLSPGEARITDGPDVDVEDHVQSLKLN